LLRALRQIIVLAIVHELPMITRVVELALEAAPKNAVIRRIQLHVGALCDADPLWLERYFRVAARGSAAEGASLDIRRDDTMPGADRRMPTEYWLESIEVLEGDP